MKRIFLVTEPDSLRTRPAGSATANVWLEINGLQFPMSHWNDFVVVVMGWWALALLRLVRGTNAREMVHFMDGPYAVEVGLSDDELLMFRALKRGLAGADEVATGEEPARLFIAGFLSRSREVLDECKRQNWWSKDAEILKSSVKALKAESKRLLG